MLGFSDLQADIAAALIRSGIEVHVFNQRSIAQILDFIRMLGGMIGVHDKAIALASTLERNVDAVRAEAARLPFRPRVYFEEWDDPMISAIRWVSELIGVAGGEDCFPGTGRPRRRRATHRRGPAGSRAPRTGPHHRILVRQEIPPRKGRCATRAGPASRRS